MKFKQKFPENHKHNKCEAGQNRTTFCTVTAIMIVIMSVAVSVNAAATTTLPTAENAARARAATMVKTLLNNTSRDPQIAQQSSKTSPPTSISAYPAASTTTINTTSLTVQKTNSNAVMATVGVADTSNSPSPSANANASPIAENMGNCKSLTGTWGDVDPNIYYLCDKQTKQPLPLRCPEGRGYFNGLGYTGCIPYDNWPACVAVHGHEQVHICDSDHMQQPWETVNPNKFYICLQETIEPMLLNCGQGKGFVHVLASASTAASSGREGGAADGGDSEIVGCTNWEKWRSYMRCTDYY